MRDLPRRPNRHLCASLLAPAVAAIALAACSHQPPAAAPPPTATTVAAATGVIVTTRDLGGFIAPLQNVSLSSNLTEPAARVHVVEGQHVTAGALLATFDTADMQAELESNIHAANEAQANTAKQYFTGAQTISSGNSNVASAASALVAAREKERLDRINLSRDAALLGEQYISQQTYDAQRETVQADAATTRADEAALASAQLTAATNGSESAGLQGASLASAREAAAQARASARQIAAQISRATLRAPIAGVVTNRNLNPGEYPGSRTLFTIQAIDTVYAQLNASSEQLAGVRIGDAVTVNAHGTNAKYAGHVAAILGQAAPGSTNFTVKVRVPNPTRALLAGMAVEGMIRLAPTHGTVIPRSALFDDDTAVGIVRNGTYRRIGVRVVAQDDAHAVVTGVSPGTPVVTGSADLRDGERVAER